MFRLCIVALLLVSPAVAARIQSGAAETVEVDFLDEKAELVMDGAARAALGAELTDDDVTAHGSALLSMFTNLSASKEEIASKFEMSPSLKQLVHDDLKNGPHARTKAARASLLERAKDTLSEHEANVKKFYWDYRGQLTKTRNFHIFGRFWVPPGPRGPPGRAPDPPENFEKIQKILKNI